MPRRLCCPKLRGNRDVERENRKDESLPIPELETAYSSDLNAKSGSHVITNVLRSPEPV